MATWSDSYGKVWKTEIHVGAIRRVQRALGVNLADLTSAEQEQAPLLTRLQTDLALLVDVLFALHQPQAIAAGIDDEGFAERLSGPAFAAACETFWKELAAFFRHLGRRELATAIEKQQALIEAAVNESERRIAAIEIDAVPGLMPVPGTDSNSATSSPASSASTPGP